MVDQKVDISELWSRLALEGNFKLLDKLQRAERHEPGYGTIIVSREGFSEDDSTHNMVLGFLRQNDTHIFNPGLEAERIRLALQDKYYED